MTVWSRVYDGSVHHVLNGWHFWAPPGLIGIGEIDVQGHVMSRAMRTLRHGEGARAGPQHLLAVMSLNKWPQVGPVLPREVTSTPLGLNVLVCTQTVSAASSPRT